MRHDQEDTGELGELLRFGTVAEVDHARGLVRVDTGDVTTDWIPWLERRAGATRSWSPPSKGEQVSLLAPGGDIEGAVMLGGIPSDDNPPAGDSTRELLKFGDGAEIAYDPESHALEVKLPEDATVLIDASGGVEINVTGGALKIYGDVEIHGAARVYDTLTADVDVVAAGKSLKGHKHLAVTPGQGVSGVPQ